MCPSRARTKAMRRLNRHKAQDSRAAEGYLALGYAPGRGGNENGKCLHLGSRPRSAYHCVTICPPNISVTFRFLALCCHRNLASYLNRVSLSSPPAPTQPLFPDFANFFCLRCAWRGPFSRVEGCPANSEPPTRGKASLSGFFHAGPKLGV
ncbi:hypothetical protein EXIGLDRAFT_256343 [Exidia glandulosa HHB12029]|uniref:Uncharacterized protein n=1 Tax=Exidia glandulosa HHB12029 TaxID=1314781 RepID=A0A165DV04_EXIGL|nr:hypothetical protein EXIGLDRAFT_256343 [Exidia glandulosa HHB12029]